MAFCKGGASTISDFLHKIKAFEPILLKVTEVTGDIKNLPSNATVQQIDAIIPDSSPLQGYFNMALGIITGTADVVGNVAQKLYNWLDGVTEDQKEANLFKLAAVATRVAHEAEGGNEKQHLYDTAVQVHVGGLK